MDIGIEVTGQCHHTTGTVHTQRRSRERTSVPQTIHNSHLLFFKKDIPHLGQFLRQVMQSPTLNAIAMGHFAQGQVTTPCLIYLPRRDGRLSLCPRTTRIRTQDPLVLRPVALPLHHGGSVKSLLYSYGFEKNKKKPHRQARLAPAAAPAAAGARESALARAARRAGVLRRRGQAERNVLQVN